MYLCHLTASRQVYLAVLSNSEQLRVEAMYVPSNAMTRFWQLYIIIAILVVCPVVPCSANQFSPMLPDKENIFLQGLLQSGKFEEMDSYLSSSISYYEDQVAAQDKIIESNSGQSSTERKIADARAQLTRCLNFLYIAEKLEFRAKLAELLLRQEDADRYFDEMVKAHDKALEARGVSHQLIKEIKAEAPK